MSLVHKQLPLFQESDPSIISGLSYVSDYISTALEKVLIEQIDAQPWITELKRRVQHYGYKYDYKARGITQDFRIGAIPDWLAGLCADLRTQGYFAQTPDQVIINEYQPGQGISPHIDCVPCFGETIASLSLGSPCVMDFMHPQSGAKSSMLLEPRSLLVLSDDARYAWQHGIAARKSDRYDGHLISRARRISLTFRKVILN